MTTVFPGFEIRADLGSYRLTPGLVLREPLGLCQYFESDTRRLPRKLDTFIRELGIVGEPIYEDFDPRHAAAWASWHVRPGLEFACTENYGGSGSSLIAVVHLIAESVDLASEMAELTRKVIAVAGGVWTRAELLSASDGPTALRRLRHARVPYDAALLEAVRPALNDPDYVMRYEAFDTLTGAPRERPDRPFWDFVLDAFHHEDEELRQRALDLADGMFDDLPPEILSVLEEMAHHSDPHVRRRARLVGLSSEERLLHAIMGSEPPSPSSRLATEST